MTQQENCKGMDRRLLTDKDRMSLTIFVLSQKKRGLLIKQIPPLVERKFNFHIGYKTVERIIHDNI